MMKCPRCNTKMSEVKFNDVNITTCVDGCGGMWFDWLELKKLDEKHEVDYSHLESIKLNITQKVNTDDKLECPNCDQVIMMTNYYSIAKKVKIDHCAVCGGHFLDHNELQQIHETFSTEKDRIDAFNKVANDMIQEHRDKLKNKID